MVWAFQRDDIFQRQFPDSDSLEMMRSRSGSGCHSCYRIHSLNESLSSPFKRGLEGSDALMVSIIGPIHVVIVQAFDQLLFEL